MKSEIKKLPKSRVEIQFEFPWGEFEFFYTEALANFNKGIILEGFRPGKAPLDIIEQKLGEGKILEEAVELALRRHYPAPVQENNLEVIGQPEVEILKLAKGNDFVCRVKAEVLPEVKLPDYQVIAGKVQRERALVDDKELDDALEWLRKSRATFEDLDRPCQKEDFVEISYQSPQIEDAKIFEDRFLLGKGHFIPGFEEHLEGMKIGEDKEFELVFPEDYFKKDLASQKASFKTTMKKVQQIILPELNDEFAKSLGKFEDMSDLRQNVKGGIMKEKETEERQRLREEILEKIMAEMEMDIPEILLTQERAKIFNDTQEQAAERLAIPFEEYVKQNYKTKEDFDFFVDSAAHLQVKSFLTLREIGRRENVEVGEEEVEAAVSQFLQRFGNTKDVEKQIDPERLRSYYKDVVYNEKVLQLLEGYAKKA